MSHAESATDKEIKDYLTLNFHLPNGAELSPELRWAYGVLTALDDQIGGTDLQRMLLSHYVGSVVRLPMFRDAVDTIERLFLPHAVELAAAPTEAVRGALKGLLGRSERWHNYQNSFFYGWMKLSADPTMVKSASNELRVIAAVHRSVTSASTKRSVISYNSGDVMILSMNTPLETLIKSRPDDIDEIVSLIISDSEVDGNRIAAVLDADTKPLATGIL